MKKVAVIFVLAVLLPSLVLAWLAVRSLRDQQFLIERQQSVIDQNVTDALAQNISDYLAQQQQDFSAQVEKIVGDRDAQQIAPQFDDEIRQNWPLAEIGFCVTLSGKILAPAPDARIETRNFYSDNAAFLRNRETAEVYGNGTFPPAQNNSSGNSSVTFAQNSTANAKGGFGGGFGGFGGANLSQTQKEIPLAFNDKLDRLKSSEQKELKTPAQTISIAGDIATNGLIAPAGAALPAQQATLNYKAAQYRSVVPQSGIDLPKDNKLDEDQKNLSSVVPAEAEFAQLVGGGNDGMLARFLQNKLNLMFWHRAARDPQVIFGAQLNLNRVVENLRPLVQNVSVASNEICVALLDDNAKPVALSQKNFSANWKRPFVATEIGDALPHWEAAAYLVNPARLTQSARTAKLSLGLLVAILLLAIGVGSWLIVASLNSELKLARQKTDFVSNVSHELKTPLTSIRMFSELLAENRVADTAKQKSYLQIITAEAARLTRLINNVLDFSRMERGEKKYNFAPCDLTKIVRSICETFRPHLEANGFKFDCELPETKIPVRGDADAISQIIVNLLSNAEKYSCGQISTPSPRPNGEKAGMRGFEKINHLTPTLSSVGGGEGENFWKEITIQLAQKQSPLPHAEIKILDRGSGVPRGSEEKIFEKFYRAHNSLSSGIQGSGLGLTIARQIARAHGGDVIYESRDGGGSCFVLRLPIKSTDE